MLPALSVFFYRCALKVVDTTGKQGREAQLEPVAPSLYVRYTIVSGGSGLSLFGSSSRTVTFGNTNILWDRFKVEAIASTEPMACFVKQPPKKSFNNSKFL